MGGILVTEAYEKMFHHLLLLRGEDRRDHGGAVITGQPGIGTSLTGSPPHASTHQGIYSPGKTTFAVNLCLYLDLPF